MMDFRSTRIWQWATVLVVALTLGVLTVGAIYLATTNNDLRSDLRAERADSRAATANAQESYEQLIAEGIKPEAEEPAKVEAPRDGESGQDGRDGRSATIEQVAYSVSVYCSTRTDCQGSPGAPSTVPGATGANGQDSTVPGPVGPMGPASTVPGPKGETGGTGDDGSDGDTGRGITEVACQDDGDWLFTMTDESTITVTGPCRVGIPATPKETP